MAQSLIASTDFLHRRAPRRAALLAASIHLALAGVAFAPLAMAQTQAASAERVQQFQIPAGPLQQVLARFMSETGIALAASSELVAGRHSPGVNGQLQQAQALQALLVGTGLEVERNAQGQYVLRVAAAQSGQLSRISVRADEVLDATTEGSGNYGSSSASLFKGARSLRDIPQPVTVLSRQWMDERGMRDLQEVLQNTTGVTLDYTDSERMSYFSRGHQIDALQYNGLTGYQSGAAMLQPDTAVMDRIEVLRGASGLLRGSGNPSATVNMVLKRPTETFQAAAAVSAGSWDKLQIQGDLSGPLTSSGAVRGRLVASLDDKDLFQRGRSEERSTVYGALEVDLSDATELLVSLLHTDLDATGAWGNLPADLDGSPLRLPRSTFLGAAWNQWDRYNQQAYVELAHAFNEDWNLKFSTNYTRTRIKQFKQTSFGRVGTADPYLFGVSTAIYNGDGTNQRAASLVLDGAFQAFGRRHELVAGVDAQSLRSIGTRGVFNVAPITVDIRNWDPYSSYPEPTDLTGATSYVGTNSEESEWGAYTTLRLSVVDPLTVIAGARASWVDRKEPARPSVNYSIDREITPYFGVVYDLTDSINAYASYTEIFEPQRSYTLAGNIIDPVRGEDYELGLKGEFNEGRLQTTLALFRIDNVGRAMLAVDQCLPEMNGWCYEAGGKTRSEGWELELTGEVLPGWQLQAGYTNTRTEYLKDPTAANVGRPLRTIDPRHLGQLFTSYRFAEGLLDGLIIGGGAQVRSDNYVTARDVSARQGGYTVFNAMASYELRPGYLLQLNVNNLSDKVYFKKYAPTGINNYYGDPRNWMLTISARFQ